ncbi:MAG: phosphoesterase [Desulfobacteraceae bacterium]|nr:MAG: phosphoesterase [Desulfobacteraceae bacterium]
MIASNKQKIKRFYEQFTGTDRVLIHINADPDAIASALAIKRLLWRRVVTVAISNINIISRPDNLNMIRLLDINMIHASKINPDLYDKHVIIDSQPNHNELFSPFYYSVIIDHHPDDGDPSPFKDIRPDYGATATIMTEYLRAARIKPSARLSTALFYAIKTDTANFERQAITADIRAFQYLFRYANMPLARKIEQADLKIEFLDDFNKALTTYTRSRNRIYIHLGPVENPDINVILADFFMRINTVTWSIVSGVYENRLIVIVRNDGLRKKAGEFVSKAFGHLGSAGGHKSMARVEIPIDQLGNEVDHDDDAKMVLWLIQKFEKKRWSKSKKI